MIKYVLVILLFFLKVAFAQDSIPIALESAPVNSQDVQSIKRGAKFFATNCMVCHSLIYLRYNSLAKEAGITYEKMPLNVKTWPFGIKPPDLSLEANVRGADWIYTYLHSFYLDPSRPTGFNNLIFPNTVMSNIVASYQGQQIRLADNQLSHGKYTHQLQWYDVLVLQTQGSMTPEEFDKTIADVVNFLVYAADPYAGEQHRMGWWVVGFLFILFILSYLLKKSYWKDVKKTRTE